MAKQRKFSKRCHLKKPAKKAVHKIKTAIVVDYMGHGFGEVTPEMEIAEHKERFSEFAEPAKLHVYTPESTYPGSLKHSTDLMI